MQHTSLGCPFTCPSTLVRIRLCVWGGEFCPSKQVPQESVSDKPFASIKLTILLSGMLFCLPSNCGEDWLWGLWLAVLQNRCPHQKCSLGSVEIIASRTFPSCLEGTSHTPTYSLWRYGSWGWATLLIVMGVAKICCWNVCVWGGADYWGRSQHLKWIHLAGWSSRTGEDEWLKCPRVGRCNSPGRRPTPELYLCWAPMAEGYN